MAEEDVNTPALAVTLERRGTRFRAIDEYSIQSSYLVSTDAFDFTAHEDEDRRLELFGLELEPVELSIEGASQCLGRIEKTSTANGANARHFSGRDYISDMVECHVDPQFKIDEGHTVADAITLCAGTVGITTILSDSDIAIRNIRSGQSIAGGTTAPDYRAEKLSSLKAKPGEGIYSLCNRIAARHHSTIQPGTARDELILSAPNFSQVPSGRIIRKLDGTYNNVQSASSVRDYSSFPTWMIGTGRFGQSAKTRTPASHTIGLFDRAGFAVTDGQVALEPTHLGLLFGATTPEIQRTTSTPARRGSSSDGQAYDLVALANSGATDEVGRTISGKAYEGRIKYGETLDDPRLLYRLHYFKDEQARNIAQLESSTMRRLSDLLKPTLTYTCTVTGHRDPNTGALWTVDTLVEVFDEIEQVFETLWVAARTFKFSAGSGRTTELELWRPSSYSI